MTVIRCAQPKQPGRIKLCKQWCFEDTRKSSSKHHFVLHKLASVLVEKVTNVKKGERIQPSSLFFIKELSTIDNSEQNERGYPLLTKGEHQKNLSIEQSSIQKAEQRRKKK